MSRLGKLIAGRFDALAETFPSSIDECDSRLNAILDRAGDIKGKRILEVGCGKGRVSRILKAKGADIYGIDISEKLLKDANGVRPHCFLKAEASGIPFKDNTFDVLILMEVIEHLPDLQGVLEEFSRVMKKTGSLIIVDRNKFSINNRRFLVPNMLIKRYHELKDEWMYPSDFPFREVWFNPARVRNILKTYFNVSEYEYILGDAERRRWWHFIFKVVPQTRHFVLWHSASKRDDVKARPSPPVAANPASAVKEFGLPGVKISERVAGHPGIFSLKNVRNPLKGMFCLRIDADEYTRGSFNEYYGMFRDYKEAITIFFNAHSFEHAAMEIESCVKIGLDVQSHAFFHHTYNDYESNRLNINRAKLFFEKMGIKTVGFASPMGKWNWPLMKALEDEGYEYSSDFGYDYLGLPSYPRRGVLTSNILEIPIFPVAPEVFYQCGIRDKDAIISYYRSAIDEMLRCGLPVIIYAHTSPEYKDVPEVLRHVAEYAIHQKKLSPVNMTKMSRIWRDDAAWSASTTNIGIPSEEFLGRRVREPVWKVVKTAVKDYMDFERVTPSAELRGPFIKRSIIRLLRTIS